MESDDSNNQTIIASRGAILGELSQLPNTVTLETTPKCSSPDEMVIQQRGPRVKPTTWSPVDYNKLNILIPPARDKTPEPQPTIRELKRGLRRRLTLSPDKETKHPFSRRFKLDNV